MPGASLAPKVWLKPGAMFSLSSTTMTPSRISHSTARSDALAMRKVLRPAGTTRSFGSQVRPVMVTVTAASTTADPARLALVDAK